MNLAETIARQRGPIVIPAVHPSVTMPPDPPAGNEKHARIRRLKRLLRFMPRRAVFHRYPLVGRFAGAARRRAYLWSFKPEHIRPAIYLGAVVAFWPVMGLQIAIVFALSLLLRANLMVAGALQFLTNPLTAAPVYFVTYHVGREVLALFGRQPPEEPSADSTDEVFTNTLETQAALSHGITDTVAALFLGGTVCGLALAVLLDLFYSRAVGRQRAV